MKKFFQRIWSWFDGKKLWTTICTILGYELAQLQIKFPDCLPIPHQIPLIGGWCVPWDWILPMLALTGITIGGGHKLVKRIQKNGALFSVLILAMLIPAIAFAMKPNQIKNVPISDTRNLVKVSETIESTEPSLVGFALSVLYQTNDADSVPLYLQVCTPNGYAGYKYSLTLRNSATGKAVFQNLESTTGLNASRRLKAWVDPDYSYVLTVSAPGSIRYRDWLLFIRYKPYLWLYAGAYSNQQIDTIPP